MINYFFALIIFISSVGQLIEQYIKVDRESKKEKIQFQKSTRQLLEKFNQDNSGFGTLLGIFTTFLFSLILYLFLLKINTDQNEIRYRLKLYQCFFDYNQDLKSYISKIQKSNLALTALFAASSSGILSPEAEILAKGLTSYQNLEHISFLKKISQNPNCSLLSKKNQLKSLPYKTNSVVILARNLDLTTTVEQEEWKIKFVGDFKNLKYADIFLLIGSYHLKNRYSNLTISGTEEDLLKLKHVSGSVSSFL